MAWWEDVKSNQGWKGALFWAVFVGLCVGVLASLIVFYVTQKRQVLEFEQVSTELITNEIAQISGIAITMDGEPVKNLTSTTVKFTNTGSQTIDGADFRKTAPLTLAVTGGHFIGEQFKAGVSSDKSPNLEPEVIPMDNNTLQIAFDCIKQKEFFSITLLHDGMLSVSGDLKDGTVKEHSSFQSNALSNILSALFAFILVFLKRRADKIIDVLFSSSKKAKKSENETAGRMDGNSPG